MAMSLDWNSTLVAGIEAWRVVALFGVIMAGLLIARLGKSALLKSAELLERRQRIPSAVALQALARSVGFLALALSFPVVLAFLKLEPAIYSILKAVQGVLLSLAFGFMFYQLVDVVFIWLRRHTDRTESKMDDMLVPIVRTGLRVIVVVLTLLQVAQSLTDKPLTSILAGLGVGGLAVALAAQDTIKHFFGSLVLFADKPFQVGDRITVDATDGVVEEVGFRSTRIRTLEGFLVTFPNGDLANKTIVNIARRPHIRHRSIINVTYDTPPASLRRAVELLQGMLENHEGMNPDFPPRVVVDDFAASSINLLVMYWYHPADFWAYKKFNEQLCLRIAEAFAREGINFAFPTQTVHVAGEAMRRWSHSEERNGTATA